MIHSIKVLEADILEEIGEFIINTNVLYLQILKTKGKWAEECQWQYKKEFERPSLVLFSIDITIHHKEYSAVYEVINKQTYTVNPLKMAVHDSLRNSF